MKSQPNIGKILSPEEDQRDAVHFAIYPAIAAHKMVPASHVGLDKDGKASYSFEGGYIGIVDPFLENAVQRGQRFYLFLYPNTITSLKHFWEHPAFDKIPEPPAPPKKKDEKSDSIEWLKNYAISEVYSSDYYEDRDQAYDALMSQVDGHELIFMGRDCHGFGDVPDSEKLFYHLSVVLGRTIDRAYFEDSGYFSCSC